MTIAGINFIKASSMHITRVLRKHHPVQKRTELVIDDQKLIVKRKEGVKKDQVGH